MLQNHLALGTSAEARIRNALAQTYGDFYVGSDLYIDTFTLEYIQSKRDEADASGQAALGLAIGFLAVPLGTDDGIGGDGRSPRGRRGGCSSFNAKTLVSTDEGEQPIVSLQVGDRVLAWNQETGEIGYYTVTDTHLHLDHTLVYLTIDGETILTTPEHPFFTESGQWVGAGELQIGSRVQQIDGDLGTVRKVAVVDQPQVMYNLSVAEANTFVVGDGQWLVHNQGPCIHMDSQGKHIAGHRNYQPGKSVLTHSDPQGRSDQYGGTGYGVRGTKGQAGYKEVVDFQQVIGLHVDQAGNATPTTRGVVHYSNRGAHIVPSR